MVISYETRIVRESDYSPTSGLFAEIVKKMLQNYPNVNLAQIDVYTKIGPILSICSQDIERKQNSDIYQGPSLCYKCAKNNG